MAAFWALTCNNLYNTLVSFLKNSTVYTLLVLLTSYDNLIDKLSFVFNKKKEYNYVMIGEA